MGEGMKEGINPDQVAAYLQEHPEFFELHSDMMANLFIPHPHGGRAIPISERQVLTLRDKNRLLEAKLAELIRFGEQNDSIGEKLHRLTVALIAAPDTPAAIHVTRYHLREDFAVPHVELRLWSPAAPSAGGEPSVEYSPISEEAGVFADSLTQPYISARAMFDSASWFGADGEGLRSFAYIPLRGRQAFGLLTLASEDPQRFYPEMGTLYLKRLGDIVAAALGRSLAG
jgi:uncharacterized protein YigA (DUF484 family)